MLKKFLLHLHLAQVLISNKIFVINFGNRVKQLRLSCKQSQEDLANTADIPINQIGRIERGEINTTLVTAKAIADALSITMEELFKDI